MIEYLEGFDEKSFMLGMIEAFCEMAAQGVKPLALSPIMEPAQWEALTKASDAVAAKYNVKSYAEAPLMSSDLVSDELIENKVVVLYYKQDDILKEYLSLKEESEKLKQEGLYDSTARKKASVSLRRLLGYN